MKYLKAFSAGFAATLVFHQGLIFILNLAGLLPIHAYNFKPTSPFGIPSVLSLSFFGGLWGILLFLVVARDQSIKFWIKSFIFGALAPTAVALFIVFPIKGIPPSLPKAFVSLFLNGFWGIGSSWMMTKMKLIIR